MAHQIQLKSHQFKCGLAALLVLISVCVLSFAGSFANQNSNTQVNSIKKATARGKPPKSGKGRSRGKGKGGIKHPLVPPPEGQPVAEKPPEGKPTPTPNEKSGSTKINEKVEEQLGSLKLSLEGIQISGFPWSEFPKVLLSALGFIVVYSLLFVLYRWWFPKSSHSLVGGIGKVGLAVIVIALVIIAGMWIGRTRGNQEVKYQTGAAKQQTDQAVYLLASIPAEPPSKASPSPAPSLGSPTPLPTSTLNPNPPPSPAPSPSTTPPPVTGGESSARSPLFTPSPERSAALSEITPSQIPTFLRAGIYLWLGLLLSLLAVALIWVYSRTVWLWVAMASTALLAFGYWSFYWHLRRAGVPDLTALGLASLPILLGFLFITRQRSSEILSRIGRLRLGTLEVEFDQAVRGMERNVLPTITLDETIFSPKRSLSELRNEARKTIDRLILEPISKRVLYLQVDMGHEMEGYFDAVALYFYLLVLREAAQQVMGSLAGVLIYKSRASGPRVIGLVRTEDYIAVLERQFPQVRKSVDLAQIQQEVTGQVSPDSPSQQPFEEIRFSLPGDTSLSGFLPRLVPYLRQVKPVSESEFESLPKSIPELLLNRVEYIAVSRDESIIAVVPLTTVTTEVARAVAEKVQNKETLAS